MSALRDVRPGLEHHPRDGITPRYPFSVNQGNALEVLEAAWGGLYLLRVRGGRYEAASRKRPGNILEAATPDELQQEIAADWGLS